MPSIPTIVCHGFQDLLEAVGEDFSAEVVSALTGAQLYERPDERSSHRSGSRERLLTIQVETSPWPPTGIFRGASLLTGTNCAAGFIMLFVL